MCASKIHQSIDKMNLPELKPASARSNKRRMLTPEQCRAARAILQWSRDDLASRAKVSPGTVVAFETAGSDAKVSTLQKLRKAFTDAGIIFVEDGATSLDGGPGLRVRRGWKP
jgi:DNA-binding XRE family transcriptional regulator